MCVYATSWAGLVCAEACALAGSEAGKVRTKKKRGLRLNWLGRVRAFLFCVAFVRVFVRGFVCLCGQRAAQCVRDAEGLDKKRGIGGRKKREESRRQRLRSLFPAPDVRRSTVGDKALSLAARLAS